MKAAQFSRAEREVMVGDEIVKLANQRWEDAEIEGGSLTLIERAGAPVYGRADFVLSPESAPSVDRARIRQLHERRFQFREDLAQRRPWRGVKFVSDPVLTLMPDRNNLVPMYRLDVLEKNERVVRLWVSPTGTVLKRERVSADLFDAQAWLYTLASGKSVQEVLLRKLVEGADVRSGTHEVTSQAPETPSSDSAPWKFPPGDTRFDQVQVYYFVQQGLDFFARELGFVMPVKIEAETAVGYPEGTGAAFSYNNQIRFGSGDGKQFRSMAQDPSVVIHEVGHVLNNVIARLPTQGEGGSLNEAFADYFAASCLGESKLGTRVLLNAPFLRDLANNAVLGEKNGGLYHDSLIVSGTLWELRPRLGIATTNKLVMKTLARLGASKALADFPAAVRESARGMLGAEDLAKVEEVLRRRQWGE